MSLVYITHHDENIYDHSKKDVFDETIVHRQIMAKSKRMSMQNNLYAKKKKINVNGPGPYSQINNECCEMSIGRKYQHRTMGPAEVPLNPPSNFLKKRSGFIRKRQVVHKCIKRFIPLVPKHNEIISLPEHRKKNFVNFNKRAVGALTPSRPLPKYAYTIHGDVRLLCNSGLMPAYIHSPNYGKVPNYLKSTSERSKFYQTRNIQATTDKGNVINKKNISHHEIENEDDFCNIKQISEEERQHIIWGLKEQWKDITSVFNSLPVFTDTIPKMKRKSDLRELLYQLERDILFLESNPAIFVKLE